MENAVVLRFSTSQFDLGGGGGLYTTRLKIEIVSFVRLPDGVIVMF